MANASFRSKTGIRADVAIKKANKKVLDATFKQTVKNVEAAAIFLEGEDKRGIKNYPLVDTGRYVNSISYNIDEDERKQTVTAKVGSTIKDPKYPTFLEFGTSKMSPKPVIRPVWNKNLNSIKKIISNGVKKGIKQGT